VPARKELWFEREEFEARLALVRAELRRHDVDVLVAFHPSSVTWLSGFFSTAYLLFACVIVPVEGEPTVVCRDNEEYWLERTGAFERRVLWEDGEAPAVVLVRALREAGAADARIGVENAYPYGPALGEAVRVALPGASVVDLGDEIVAAHREIKSPAEVDYIRAAARAVEAGMRAGVRAAAAGVSEREIAAAISGALILGGSDVAGPGPMGSGERAEHLHAAYEDRTLVSGDTLTLEVDGCVRQYYARFFRTVKIGRATPAERRLAERLIALQEAAWAEVGDGRPVDVPDRIIREGIEAETGRRYTNNSFSSIGLTLFPPARSMLVVRGSTGVFRAGMTFHSYVKVGAFVFSETILVTDTGHELLTTHPRELIVTPT
jgi:Xaa-Pro dipeptidase